MSTNITDSVSFTYETYTDYTKNTPSNPLTQTHKQTLKGQQGDPHHSPLGPGAPHPFDGSEAPPPGSAGCNDCMQTPRGGAC